MPPAHTHLRRVKAGNRARRATPGMATYFGGGLGCSPRNLKKTLNWAVRRQPIIRINAADLIRGADACWDRRPAKCGQAHFVAPSYWPGPGNR